MTPKQRVFIDHYLETFNATQSAIAAGYSEKTARATASRLLTYDNIKAEIENRLATSCMTANEALAHLATIARDGETGHQLKALELIAKHHGLFENRLHIETVQIDMESLSVAQLQAIARGADHKDVLR